MVIMTVNIPAPTIIAFRIALNGVLRGPFYEVSIDDLFDALLAEVQALLAEDDHFATLAWSLRHDVRVSCGRVRTLNKRRNYSVHVDAQRGRPCVGLAEGGA